MSKLLTKKSDKSLTFLKECWDKGKGNMKAVRKLTGLSESSWKIFSEEEWNDFFTDLEEATPEPEKNLRPQQKLNEDWTYEYGGYYVVDRAGRLFSGPHVDHLQAEKSLAKTTGDRGGYTIEFLGSDSTNESYKYFEPYSVQAKSGKKATVSSGRPVMKMSHYGHPDVDLLGGNPVQPGKFYAISYRTGAWMGPYDTAEEAARHSQIIKVFYNEDLDAIGRWVSTPLRDIVAADPDRGTYVGYVRRSQSGLTNQADALVKWGSPAHFKYDGDPNYVMIAHAAKDTLVGLHGADKLVEFEKVGAFYIVEPLTGHIFEGPFDSPDEAEEYMATHPDYGDYRDDFDVEYRNLGEGCGDKKKKKKKIDESFTVDPLDTEERATIIRFLKQRNILWAPDLGKALMVFGDGEDIADMHANCEATFMVNDYFTENKKLKETGEYDKGDPVALLKCPKCGNTDSSKMEQVLGYSYLIKCHVCGYTGGVDIFDTGLTESKKLKEDWGSSDWTPVMRNMDAFIDRHGLNPENIRDAAYNEAAFYYDTMGYDNETDAQDAIISMWLRRSEKGKQVAAFFSEGKVNEVMTKCPDCGGEHYTDDGKACKKCKGAGKLEMNEAGGLVRLNTSHDEIIQAALNFSKARKGHGADGQQFYNVDNKDMFDWLNNEVLPAYGNPGCLQMGSGQKIYVTYDQWNQAVNVVLANMNEGAGLGWDRDDLVCPKCGSVDTSSWTTAFISEAWCNTCGYRGHYREFEINESKKVNEGIIDPQIVAMTKKFETDLKRVLGTQGFYPEISNEQSSRAIMWNEYTIWGWSSEKFYYEIRQGSPYTGRILLKKKGDSLVTPTINEYDKFLKELLSMVNSLY